jgi:hypothetical protein
VVDIAAKTSRAVVVAVGKFRVKCDSLPPRFALSRTSIEDRKGCFGCLQRTVNCVVDFAASSRWFQKVCFVVSECGSHLSKLYALLGVWGSSYQVAQLFSHILVTGVFSELQLQFRPKII